MKKTKFISILTLASALNLLFSCDFQFAKESSENANGSFESSSSESSKNEITSSESSKESSSDSSFSSEGIKSSDSGHSSSGSALPTIDYEEVNNSSLPTFEKTYRVVPELVTDDEFTVYNVKYDTEKYLAYPTTLTIKKTDYCYTYETVALYYQAFRTVPPNYFFKNSSELSDSENCRTMQSFTLGLYSGKNSYTESLGTFNKNDGTYLELDIALNSSYGAKNRGMGRLVVVVDGLKDYGETSPVCYFTNNHYSTFTEFYNYATGWGPSFPGLNQTSSPRQIPKTVSVTK